MKKISTLFIIFILIVVIIPIEADFNKNIQNINNESLFINEFEIIDQYQMKYSINRVSAAFGSKLAQSFIPTIDSISKIKLYMYTVGNPYKLNISICNDLYEEPLTSTELDGNMIEDYPQWFEIDFPDIEINAGSIHYIVWYQRGGGNDDAFKWFLDDENSYQNGTSWYYEGEIWNLIETINPNVGDFCFKTYGFTDNPMKPDIPYGTNETLPFDEQTFTTTSTDPNDNDLFYKFDWDDGTETEWLGPYKSNEVVESSHHWVTQGIYNIKVITKNINELYSQWSNPLIIGIPERAEGINQFQVINDERNSVWTGSLAQSFQPTLNTLTKIKILIKRVGEPKDLKIKIVDSFYKPELYSTIIDSNNIDTELKWIQIDIPDLEVNPNEPYYIILETNYQYNSINTYFWSNSENNEYLSGDAWKSTLAKPWYILNSESDKIDFCFKTFGVSSDFHRPSDPIISGNRSGKYGEEQQYSFISTDVNNSDLYYKVDWGDGNNTDWTGPFSSGLEIIQNHVYGEIGDYIIKVKSMNQDEVESNESAYEISMPKLKLVDILIKLLGERLPNITKIYTLFKNIQYILTIN